MQTFNYSNKQVFIRRDGRNKRIISTFAHCEVAVFLWQKLLREVGLIWASSSGRSYLLSGKLSALGKGKRAKVLWGCGLLVVNWVIWMEEIKGYLKPKVVQSWKDFWRELSSGHLYGPVYLGSLKITLFPQFFFDWKAVVV